MKKIKFLLSFALIASLFLISTLNTYALEEESQISETINLSETRRKYILKDGTEFTVREVNSGETTNHTISGDFLIVDEGYELVVNTTDYNYDSDITLFNNKDKASLWVLDQLVGTLFVWGVTKAAGFALAVAEAAFVAAVAAFGSPTLVLAGMTVAVYFVAASMIAYSSYKYSRRLNYYGCLQYMPGTNWVCMQR